VKVRRQDVLDEVVRGDEAVVLWAGQVLRLSALAHSIRQLSADWVELSVLARLLAERHGEPGGDPVEALRPMVRDLASAGLVETRE
jgi:hypothetical protein